MIRLICFFHFALTFSFVFGQVSGVVKDIDTQTTLAFVNIGVKNKIIGTVTDQNGFFSFKGELSIGDTLVFSYVGYKNCTSIIRGFPSYDMSVGMQSHTIELKAISIVALKPKKHLLGSTTEATKMFAGFPSNSYLGSQMGIVINKKSRNLFLESINFFFAHDSRSNKADTVKLRLNLYEISNENMFTDITPENIIFEPLHTKGWHSYDISEYNIVISKKTIATLEWVGFSGNMADCRITFSAAPWKLQKLFIKLSSQTDWWIPKIGGPIGLYFNAQEIVR